MGQSYAKGRWTYVRSEYSRSCFVSGPEHRKDHRIGQSGGGTKLGSFKRTARFASGFKHGNAKVWVIEFVRFFSMRRTACDPFWTESKSIRRFVYERRCSNRAASHWDLCKWQRRFIANGCWISFRLSRGQTITKRNKNQHKARRMLLSAAIFTGRDSRWITRRHLYHEFSADWRLDSKRQGLGKHVEHYTKIMRNQDNHLEFNDHPYFDWEEATSSIFRSWQGGPFARYSPCGNDIRIYLAHRRQTTHTK